MRKVQSSIISSQSSQVERQVTLGIRNDPNYSKAHGFLEYQGDFHFSTFSGYGSLKADNFTLKGTFTSLYDCIDASLKTSSFEYIGPIKDLQPHGKGEINESINNKKITYVGQFRFGKKHGVGIETTTDQNKQNHTKYLMYDHGQKIKNFDSLGDEFYQIQQKIDNELTQKQRLNPQILNTNKSNISVKQIINNVRTGIHIQFNSSINFIAENLIVADYTKQLKTFNNHLHLLKSYELLNQANVCANRSNNEHSIGFSSLPFLQRLKEDKSKLITLINYSEDQIVQAISYSADRVISGGKSCKVKIWDERSKNAIQQVSNHRNSITDILKINGHTIASCSDYSPQNNGEIIISDLRTGKSILNQVLQFEKHTQIGAYGMVYDFDYDRIGIAMSRGLFSLLDWKQQQIKQRESDKKENYFQGLNFISPCYLYGGYSELLHVYDESHEMEQKFKTGCSGAIKCIKPENNKFFIGDSNGYIGKYQVEIK